MSSFFDLLQGGTVLTGLVGASYAGTVAAVALMSVLVKNPQRRRDARETLRLLVRRRDR
ncbi:hypothetical protein [Streptomyces cucumeris]|uniref:hypothetical protein n=1 Tax=Streptomyces cucumeris TaxID=2962890 RepID=UPI003D7095A9